MRAISRLASLAARVEYNRTLPSLLACKTRPCLALHPPTVNRQFRAQLFQAGKSAKITFSKIKTPRLLGDSPTTGAKATIPPTGGIQTLPYACPAFSRTTGAKSQRVRSDIAQPGAFCDEYEEGVDWRPPMRDNLSSYVCKKIVKKLIISKR